MTNMPGGPAEFRIGEPLILIYISRELANGKDVYEAIHRAWKISFASVENQDGSYKLVLARDKDRVVGAYRPSRWRIDREIPDRKAFDGSPAEQSTWSQYVGKTVPARFLPKGSQNPIRYLKPGD